MSNMYMTLTKTFISVKETCFLQKNDIQAMPKIAQ